jgi:hypothetical protein
LEVLFLFDKNKKVIAIVFCMMIFGVFFVKYYNSKKVGLPAVLENMNQVFVEEDNKKVNIKKKQAKVNNPQIILPNEIFEKKNKGEKNKSLLEKYSGFYPDEESEKILEKEKLLIEQYTTKCMKNLGYDYIQEKDISVDDSSMSFDEIINLVESQSEKSPLRKMSYEERESYYIALYGITNPYAESVDELGDINGGCAGKANLKVALKSPFKIYDALRDEYRQLIDNVNKDSRVVSVIENWSNCMSKRGFMLSSPEKVIEIISLRQGLKNENEIKVDEPTEGNYSNYKEYERALDIQMAKKLNREDVEKLEKTNRLCSQNVNLYQVKNSVKKEYEEKLINMHSKIFNN